MAEVAGLVLGVAGLAGLFSTCLDLMDKVVAARDAQEDYQTSFSNYRACKMLFEEWGNSAELQGGEPRDPEKRKAVYHILASIEQLFTNVSQLRNRYGVSVPTREEASDKSKHPISLMMKARWAVRDKRKFEDLTAMIATFTERLRQLVPVADKETLEMQESLSSLTGLVNETSREQANAAESALRHHQVIDEFIQGKKRKAMMKWLRAVSCEAAFDTITRESIPGSCEWFLGYESYQTWKSADYVVDLPEVLWCYGGPGVGKTYLSAKIVKDIKSTTSLPVCFFFASHGDERKREPLSLIGSWIYQLAAQRVSVFEKLKSTYNMRKDEEIITETELWDLFSFSIGVADRCYLLVDGFDELTDEHGQARPGRVGARDTLLRSLMEILSKEAKRSRVHLAIISRQETDIKRRVSESQDKELAIVRKHGIDPSDNANDLLVFCRKLVDEAVGDMEEKFRLDLAQKMADRSNGMMLWPYLVSQEIQPGRTESQLLGDIQESPRGLEHAYMRDLRKIEKMGPKPRERAIEILRWTLFSVQPLSGSQITYALSIDAENTTINEDNIPSPLDDKYIESQILGPCGSLLRYRRQTHHYAFEKDYVELAHFSVKEFLLGEANTSSIQFNERDSHGQLAAACLTYLAWDGFNDHQFERERFLRSKDNDEITRLYTEFFYYCHMWQAHAWLSLSGASRLWEPIGVFLVLLGPRRYTHYWWTYIQPLERPEDLLQLDTLDMWVVQLEVVDFDIVVAFLAWTMKHMGFWSLPLEKATPLPVTCLAVVFTQISVNLVSGTALFRRVCDIREVLRAIEVFCARIWLVAFLSFLNSRCGRIRKSWPSPWLLVELVRRPWLWPTASGPSPLCSLAPFLRVAAIIFIYLAFALFGEEVIQWFIWSPTISYIISSPSLRELRGSATASITDWCEKNR